MLSSGKISPQDHSASAVNIASSLIGELLPKSPGTNVGQDWNSFGAACPLTKALGDYQVWSETGRLKRVIIGEPLPGINYDPLKAPPIDLLTRATQEAGRCISGSQAVDEFCEFKRVLESYGALVVSPRPIEGAYNQIYTRDVGMVIGGTLVPASMTHGARSIELAGLSTLIAAVGGDGRSIACCGDPKATFEGGDILVHDGKIFVGLSERTNVAGLEWLRRTFPELAVVPIQLVKPSDSQEALHLDCAFAVLGDGEKKVAMFAPSAIANLEEVLPALHRWQLLEVTAEEQAQLGTNILSIDPKHVIIRDRCERLIAKLKDQNFTPIPLRFDAAASLGGLFRCCSFPLYRE